MAMKALQRSMDCVDVSKTKTNRLAQKRHDMNVPAYLQSIGSDYESNNGLRHFDCGWGGVYFNIYNNL